MNEIKNVLVTGASGRIASFVIPLLIEKGLSVITLDRNELNPTNHFILNLKSWDDLQKFKPNIDIHAVIHLAAIPTPKLLPFDNVFTNNVLSTRNVLEFSVQNKINKVIISSSESVLGAAYSGSLSSIKYLPIDELHPTTITDSYSASKLIGENICDSYALKYPNISISTLRFSWVLGPDYYLTKLKEAQSNIKRASSKIFSYSDIRDVSQVCFLALKSNIPGHNQYYISADDSLVDIPNSKLISQHFNSKIKTNPNFNEYSSFISNEKAKIHLKYNPINSWRNDETQ